MIWRKIKVALLFLYFGFSPLLTRAAENYKPGDKLYVAPISGLNIRELPNKNATVLTQLAFNTMVTIMPDSLAGNPYQIAVSDFKSGKLILKGKWVKVSTGKITGYVFDGMLSRFKGLPLDGSPDEEAYYQVLFGKPNQKTIKKSKVIEGHKENYETKFIYYPRGLKMESTFWDGCYNEIYTFSISFNETYWLAQRMVLDGDAMQDIKIRRVSNQTVFSFSSCT